MIDKLSESDDKYTKSTKTIFYKLCLLERQICYSLDLNQFFTGLVLFELHRTPSQAANA